MTGHSDSPDIAPLPGVAADLLGESPFWHPEESALYWCDIPGRKVRRYQPRSGRQDGWDFDTEVGCIAPRAGGGLLVALRDGLWQLDTATGERARLAPAPYDPAGQRFNDGKADARGRFWAGTVHERREPQAALYRREGKRFVAVVEGLVTSNGLAWSPDARTLYCADTPRHEIGAYDFDLASGALSNRRVLRRFEPRADGVPYGGRPDGAAVDAEGAYWVAMFEGARVLRLSPAGEVLREIVLPVQCPTMPCFGGPDLRTLYVTTARHKRPPEELAAQPAAGCVLRLRVDVAGLPVNFAAA